MRIVSLLPSATEIICALGLQDQLVGASHECDYPAGVSDLPIVTRSTIVKNQTSRGIDDQVRAQLQTTTALYTLDLELLESLRPDLIVTQALCDVCAVSADDVAAAIALLPGPPAMVSLEPANLADVFTTIRLVADAADRKTQGEELAAALHSRIARVTAAVAGLEPRRVAMLEWIDPLFNAGHWNPELIELAGGLSVTGASGKPSRTMSMDELRDAAPDVLLIACCGFGIPRTLQDLPALTTTPGWLDLPCVRNDQVFVADGNHYFNRPGPRLIDSLEIIADVLHPDRGLRSQGVPGAERVPMLSIQVPAPRRTSPMPLANT